MRPHRYVSGKQGSTISSLNLHGIIDAHVSAAHQKDWSMPGFGTGTCIETSFGDVPVELLRRGDPVRTLDGQFLEVAFVDTVQFDRRYLLTHPQAQPVELPIDALGRDRPSKTTLLSGGQLVVKGENGRNNLTVACAELISSRSARRVAYGYFSYHIFHFGVRCAVFANGICVEVEPEPYGSKQVD